MHYRFLVLLVFLAGCSIEEKKCSTSSPDQCSAPESTVAAAPTPPAAADKKPDPTDGGNLQGYIASAFDLTVDGKHYSDSEDFYTQQLDVLTQEVSKAGYEGYSMQFDAQIGLDDLKYGMAVYVAAIGSGFGGETRVDGGGRFNLAIPSPHGSETFQIRSNKRVSVLLTNPDDGKVIKWCYNFSGHAADISLDKYAIINEFTVKLTKYACDVNSSGMTIPANTTAATPKVSAPASAPTPSATKTDEAQKEFDDYVKSHTPAAAAEEQK